MTGVSNGSKEPIFRFFSKALLVALKDAQKNIIRLLLCLLNHRQNPAVRIILMAGFFISHYRPTLKVNENKVER